MFYSGDDATAVEFILMGGHGGISVTANITPKQVASAYQFALENDRELAESTNAPLADLHQHLFIESNPIPIKWAMFKMGKCNNGIRLPLMILSQQAQAMLEQDLSNLGII